jgi:4-diphosphocytidyl-2-C-methyl-D-erythritol kinase
MQQLVLDSPAKLNLMLHITGRREDGYHLLQTVFQFIDLNDRIEFITNQTGQISRGRHDSPVAEHDDLLLRAARLLQDRYAVQQGVTINIDKRIPMGGGLGGGSSDAASSLMALNKLWNLQLSNPELREIGLELGADVPIFIFGKNAWAEGVGDRLQPVNLPEKWYLVIHPSIFVSTAQIFTSKDLTRDCHPIKIRAFLEGQGRNVCEDIARRLYPPIDQALDWLGRFGEARMTGTGACVFAAFDSEGEARQVQSGVPEEWTGYVARSLASNPVTDSCFAE